MCQEPCSRIDFQSTCTGVVASQIQIHVTISTRWACLQCRCWGVDFAAVASLAGTIHTLWGNHPCTAWSSSWSIDSGLLAGEHLQSSTTATLAACSCHGLRHCPCFVSYASISSLLSPLLHAGWAVLCYHNTLQQFSAEPCCSHRCSSTRFGGQGICSRAGQQPCQPQRQLGAIPEPQREIQRKGVDHSSSGMECSPCAA